MNRDISQYKIFNEIGKGSFGKVYKGIDKLTGEEVALKFIEKKYFFGFILDKNALENSKIYNSKMSY